MGENSDNEASPPNKKRKRSRTGCLNCRRRRKLCDERKPGCVRCERMGEQCTWPAAFSFRESGWQDKVGSATSKQDAESESPPGVNRHASTASKDFGAKNTGSRQNDLTFVATTVPPKKVSQPTPAPAADNNILTPSSTSTTMPGPLPATMTSPLESPDAFVGYYPNAEYKKLHGALYDAMVDTARESGSATRVGTPDRLSQPTNALHLDHILHKEEPAQPKVHCTLPNGITPTRERELWASYLGEISTWLDMFDNANHFRVHLPIMAQSSAALRLSVLALASRQLERKDPNKPYLESLALYHEAIHLITQELRFMQTPLIASCVLLCVLEMMSSSPRDWARHLEGCASLIKAAGIDGAVGGIEQAIFWCFARMDMWGSYLTESDLRIPTTLWFFPVEPITATLDRLKQKSSSFDQYANLAVFLCASCINVLLKRDQPHDEPYSNRWRAMFDLLETWHKERPPEMLPILYSPDSDTSGGFPMVLFTNPSAISGNQLYHAAALLMLQSKPNEVKIRSHKSLFWHARHIIGITASNSSHSAYTNAPQPLWIAGRILSHPAEHRTVLRLLDVIEQETGFATAWRAEDLSNHWGEV